MTFETFFVITLRTARKILITCNSFFSFVTLYNIKFKIRIKYFILQRKNILLLCCLGVGNNAKVNENSHNLRNENLFNFNKNNT